MKGMFQTCVELEYLDLTNFDISNVTDMSGMFNQCIKLKEIKGLNNFNTKKIVSMPIMFQECIELRYLDLSNFDTSNVINMSFMFNGCIKLKEIKGMYKLLSNDVADITGIFQDCYELEY